MTSPSNPTITIFTPTYNRAYILGKLYKSLVAQTSKGFCWLVVDDGSTDNTEQFIASYIDEGLVDIRYIKQENGGKQRAWNTAVANCTTELFFCVDSDDHLVPDAVESLLGAWHEVASDQGVAGILSQRGGDANTPLGGSFPDVERTTYWDLNTKYHVNADTAPLYRTDILRRFPYPVEPGEKFIAETWVFYKIDQEYQMVLLPKVTQIADYQSDGYTHNARKVSRENPVGYMRIKRLYIDLAETFEVRFTSTILYLVGAFYAKCFWKAWADLPNKAEATLAILPALLLANTEFRK